jgi:hypothetical protein
VAAAAQLGAFLRDDWADWRLSRITPLEPGTPDATSLEFQIATLGRTIVVWGHAPGAEVGREPPAADKLLRLQSLAARPHGIEGDEPALIDLRRAPAAAAPARTAARAPSDPRRW